MRARGAPSNEAQAKRESVLRLVGKEEPRVHWADYPRLEPGDYTAYCAWSRWYWDPGFKRWTCLLRFNILSADLHQSLGTVPMWFNGGTGSKPQAGRRSRYFPAWVEANGRPPARNDRLSPSVFVRRMARVRVADTTRNSVPYSVVQKVLEWSTGQEVNQSHSQGRHAATPYRSKE